MSEPTVTISREMYERLLDKEAKLDMLEAFGVDSWQGYDEAMDELYNGDPDT